MAETYLDGTDGSCKLNTATFPVTNWEYTGNIVSEETTPVGSSDRTFESTIREGSGSVTFKLDADQASQKVLIDQLLSANTPEKVLLQLYQDLTGAAQLYFSAIITSIAFPKSAAAIDTVTISFIKTGVLSHVPTT